MDARVKPAHGDCYFFRCFARNSTLRARAMSALALS
jgi:hypothetical protein